MKSFSLWQNAWKDGYECPITIRVPDSWDVEFHSMRGDFWPSLTHEQLRDRILHPIGTPPIHEFARGGKQAVIVFDDLSRGTPTQKIAEIVLEELHSAGIPKENIRFLCALGTHGPLTRADFARKLGEEIVRNYPVFNHNAFYGCVPIGTNRRGEPVLINKEFMDCDIRIGIGSVSPHPMNGYGGGGKLLFPGLAHIDTTVANHRHRAFTSPGTIHTDCGFRTDIEEMVKMVGQFFAIDAVLNAKLDIVDLYAGDPFNVYYTAAEVSSSANAMEKGSAKDIVIANANAKFNESLIAVDIAGMELKEGGDIVLINHCPYGQVVHYTYGSFGLAHGGRLWRPHAERGSLKCRRLIYYTPWPDPCSALQLDDPEKVVFATTWDEVLAFLGEYDSGASVSILSDGSIGYFPSALK